MSVCRSPYILTDLNCLHDKSLLNGKIRTIIVLTTYIDKDSLFLNIIRRSSEIGLEVDQSMFRKSPLFMNKTKRLKGVYVINRDVSSFVCYGAILLRLLNIVQKFRCKG